MLTACLLNHCCASLQALLRAIDAQRPALGLEQARHAVLISAFFFVQRFEIFLGFGEGAGARARPRHGCTGQGQLGAPDTRTSYLKPGIRLGSLAKRRQPLSSLELCGQVFAEQRRVLGAERFSQPGFAQSAASWVPSGFMLSI